MELSKCYGLWLSLILKLKYVINAKTTFVCVNLDFSMYMDKQA